MQVNKKKITVFSITAILVIIIDRISKYAIRTTPSLQNFQIIKGWLAFNYTQNPGMAMGIDFIPTPVIGIFSIVAVILILIFAIRSSKNAPMGQVICWGLIVGGALGNLIDRMFMGIIQSAGGFMDGRVVDFIHFTPEIYGHPVFPYIFNFADACITTSILVLLVFNKYMFPQQASDKNQAGTAESNGSQTSTDNDQISIIETDK